MLEIDPKGGHEPLTLQRRRTELEQERAKAVDRAGDIALDLVQRTRGLGGGQIPEHLESHVDRAHHLDRVVVDVGGDLPAFDLLGMLQPLRELPSLLQRVTQDVEAPPELLLGFLAIGDVEHDAAPEQDRSVLGRAPATPRRASTRPARPS